MPLPSQCINNGAIMADRGSILDTSQVGAGPHSSPFRLSAEPTPVLFPDLAPEARVSASSPCVRQQTCVWGWAAWGRPGPAVIAVLCYACCTLLVVSDAPQVGFPRSSVGKESACDAGDPGSIPGSGRSPGEGNGNPLQYFSLENPMDRRAWRATIHGLTKGWT